MCHGGILYSVEGISCLQQEMMSDHNSLDLAPQRKKMSVENVSLGLVPQGQKTSDYDNRLPRALKTKSDLSILFVTRYKKTVSSPSSRNIDNTDVHSFQPQSYDYRWTRDHPLEQVRGNPTMPVQTTRQLATYPEMCMVRQLTVTEGGGLCCSARRVSFDPDHPEKVYLLRKALYGLKQALKPWYMNLSNFLCPKAFLKHFSDADHAGCLDTRKSTSGGIQFLGDKLVSWMSKKQNCTAMSSQAEYVGFSILCSSNVDEDTTSRLWLLTTTNNRDCNSVIA
ncbi:hypothetical protein Tco_1421102 [Tanacetum coccineum]